MESVDKKQVNYFTEQEVIKRYAERRDMPVDEVEDLYNVFKKYLLFKLNDTSNSPKAGFMFPKFCSFLHKYVTIDDLRKAETNSKYKRAAEQLHHYLSGHQQLKFK